MNEARKTKGTWAQRILIICATILFTLLVYWFLDFVITDINNMPGPSYDEVASHFQDLSLINESKEIDNQLAEINGQISYQKEQQGLLSDSTNSSQQTLNQL